MWQGFSYANLVFYPEIISMLNEIISMVKKIFMIKLMMILLTQNG